jgi:hypothetical protein
LQLPSRAAAHDVCSGHAPGGARGLLSTFWSAAPPDSRGVSEKKHESDISAYPRRVLGIVPDVALSAFCVDPAFDAKLKKPIGMTVDVFLHETGYAVFDMLEITFLGPEEDVADQFATYIELQFAKEDARRVILGVAFLGRGQAQEELASNPQVQEFADVHGTPAQRYFNAPDALTRVAAHGHRKN